MQIEDFKWDDNMVSAFLFYRNLYINWCDCMDCFKRRYVAAYRGVSRLDNESDYDFTLRVVKNMKY